MDRPLPPISSPHLKEERKHWGKTLVLLISLLIIIVLGILSIYWGADHSLQFNTPVFTTAIIDFDNGEVGPFLQQMGATARTENPLKTLGYVSEPGSKYNFSNERVKKALHDEHFWFAIVIQANATTAMNYAYETGNTTYDPTGSVHLYWGEGRNALAIDEFAYPMLMAFLNSFIAEFAQMKQKALATTNAGNVAALTTQAQTPIPISYSNFNTAPYVPSTAEAATEIGTIYLIIISFISVLTFDGLHGEIMGKISHTRYKTYRMILLPSLYFILSVLYMTLSCMWQIRFDKFYGASGYVIYWMLTWCGMMAFGLVVENVHNVLGLPFTPVFFVFWVISNVATGFFPVELLSNFYRWGLAWPLRQVLVGGKAVIFGTKNELGLNFGILLAWVAVSIVLQYFTIDLQLRKKKDTVQSNKKELMEKAYGEDERQKE